MNHKYPYPSEPTPFDYVKLQKQRVAVQAWVDLTQFERREYLDEMNRRMRTELSAFVYGVNHPTRHVIRFPKNWLEAVKERFAPAWLRDRWPVVYTVVTASMEEIYPDIRPSLPMQQYPPVWKVAVSRQDEVPIW